MGDNLDAKLADLESADTFLQESYRLVTERTVSLESQTKQFEDIHTLLKSQKHEKIEKNLEGKVNQLLTSVGEIVSQQDVISENITSVESLLESTGKRVEVLETNAPEIRTLLLEEVSKLEVTAKTDLLNIQETNKKTCENISDIEIEVKNTLESISFLRQKIDEMFQRAQSTETIHENREKDIKEEIKDVKGMLVLLQFQAEKTEYVETLASKVNQIDEDRQKKDAETKDEFEGLTKKNLEEINNLKKSVQDSFAVFQDEVYQEKEFTKSEFGKLTNKLNVINGENEIFTIKFSELEPYAQGINTKLAELEDRFQENISLLLSKTEEQRNMIDQSATSLLEVSEKIVSYEKDQKETVETLNKSYEKEFGVFKQEMDAKVTIFITKADNQEDKIENIDVKISSINKELFKNAEQFQSQTQYFGKLKQNFEKENELIVKRFSEQKDAMETVSSTLHYQFEKIGKLETNEVKYLEDVNQIKIAITDLENKTIHLEQSGAEQNSLILAVEKTVTEIIGEVGQEMKANAKTFRDEMRSIRTDMTTDKENLWTLVVEIYSSFRGYTLVVKSEGAVSEHQGDVLGVYRMVDSYNDRPVYKQDGGENYIYYSSASASWCVGTVVGHQYCWLRNGSTAASSARWLPDLSTGWEYRPLTRGEDSLSSWQSDDGTLRVESLRDVEKVTELIRDIKNSDEVD